MRSVNGNLEFAQGPVSWCGGRGCSLKEKLNQKSKKSHSLSAVAKGKLKTRKLVCRQVKHRRPVVSPSLSDITLTNGKGHRQLKHTTLPPDLPTDKLFVCVVCACIYCRMYTVRISRGCGDVCD